jgi:predicted Fe-Mo cluster-binding NifX family protein
MMGFKALRKKGLITMNGILNQTGSNAAGVADTNSLLAKGVPLLFAIASKDGTLVDEHFGHARELYIYEYRVEGENESVIFKERRAVRQYCDAECGNRSSGEPIDESAAVIADCVGVIVMRIGYAPERALIQRGVRVFTAYNYIEVAVKEAGAIVRGSVSGEL